MLRKRRRMTDDSDDDPMAGIANLSDAMLVLAVGFLIFAIMAISENPQIISDAQQSQSQDSGSQVSTGDTYSNNSNAGASDSGSGYNEVGKVYRDPDTGKLVMVES